MTGMSEEYKAAIRDLMRRKGKPIEWDESAREQCPEWPEFWVSTYGWGNIEATYHCTMAPPGTLYPDQYGNCEWVVEPGVKLVEQTYSQFTGTLSDNAQEVGINVGPVHCKCGKFTDVTLRYTGSLGDVLRELFGPREPGVVEVDL